VKVFIADIDRPQEAPQGEKTVAERNKHGRHASEKRAFHRTLCEATAVREKNGPDREREIEIRRE